QANREDYNRFAAENSEVVIVFDYSGSMNTNVKATGMSRKDTALEALRTCLRNIPDGVRVSLLTFSAETDRDRVTAQWRQVPWDSSAGAVNERVKQLRTLTPKYDTPLVRATVEARGYFTKDFKGAKTLVILTDGGDNAFYSRDRDLREKYGETMEKCLKTA